MSPRHTQGAPGVIGPFELVWNRPEDHWIASVQVKPRCHHTSSVATFGDLVVAVVLWGPAEQKDAPRGQYGIPPWAEALVLF